MELNYKRIIEVNGNQALGTISNDVFKLRAIWTEGDDYWGSDEDLILSKDELTLLIDDLIEVRRQLDYNLDLLHIK